MKQSKITCITRSFQAIMAFVLCFQLAAGVAAQTPKSGHKSRPKLNVALGLTSMYDDNILKYSEEYINRFLNQEDEGRFQIETYDDVVLSPEIQLDVTYRIFHGLNTALNAEYKLTGFVMNEVKNRSFLSFGLRQFITKKASIKISYNYIPEFYVRHFRDDDWVEVIGYTTESFKPFSFTKNNYGIEAQNTFMKNTRIRLGIDYAHYYYNQHFTEYDCNNLAYEINLRQSVNKLLKVEFGYTYTQSKAKGYDEAGETRLLSNDADGSFNDNLFLIRALYNLPEIRKIKHGVDVKCEFGKRYYTSEKSPEQDQFHVGRTDNNLFLNGSYIMELSKAIEVSAFFNWFNRKADSEVEQNKQLISEEKDYNQHQVGLAFTYKFKI